MICLSGCLEQLEFDDDDDDDEDHDGDEEAAVDVTLSPHVLDAKLEGFNFFVCFFLFFFNGCECFPEVAG